MNCLKITIAIFAALMLASCAKETVTGAGPDREPGTVVDGDGVMKGWVRIKLQEQAEPLRVGAVTRGEMVSNDPQLAAIAQELGAVEVRRVFADGGKFAERRRKFGLHLWYDIRFDENVPVSRAASELNGLQGVRCVEPIYTATLFDDEPGVPGEAVYTPANVAGTLEEDMPFNDPYLSKQWHYNNDGSMSRSVAGADIRLFDAWKTTTGNREVIVAITDGGVEWTHPDLAANMWINEAELNGTPGVDDDGNGYIDDVYGWNCLRHSGEIVPQSHGTHVAGTVSAVNNNGIGVCGVAGGTGNGDGVRLMSCQVFDTVSGENYPEAFTYAADNGAVISQNSWGYTTASEIPKALSDAFDYFIANAGTDENGIQTGPMKGGVIIFATGNNGVRRVSWPAADPRVVAVTAMSPDYTVAGYTNYGPEADIYAPGGADSQDTSYFDFNRVYSTDLDGKYVYKSGTSMACPHVSGVAALIVSHYGVGKKGFTADDLKARLLRSVRSVSDYIDDAHKGYLGVGLLDASLIGLEDSKTKPQNITGPEAAAKQNVVTLSWIVPADGNDMYVTKFVVAYKGKGVGKFAGVYADVSGEMTYDNFTKVGARASYTFAGAYNTAYDFEVQSVDRFGNVSDGKAAFSYTTGDYTNQKPKSLQIPSMEIENAGSENAVTIDLTKYFTDANIADGDVLTYTVKNRNEGVVKTTVESGKLVVEPLAKGNASLSVYAADLDNEQALASFTVTVKNGGAVVPPVTDGAEISVMPNPVGATLNVAVSGWKSVSAAAVVYDSAARRLVDTKVQLDANGKGAVDVSKLSPGVYSIALKYNGATLKASFVKK